MESGLINTDMDALIANMSNWIEVNQDRVYLADRLAKSVSVKGLSRADRKLKFQILPIDGDGTAFMASVHIDHPIYGHSWAHVDAANVIDFEFSSDLWIDGCHRLCTSEEDAMAFINELATIPEIDTLMILEHACDQGFLARVNTILAGMVEDYRAVVDPEFTKVKAYISDRRDRIAIHNNNASVWGDEYIRLSKIQGRTDLALLTMPSPFVVLKHKPGYKEVADEEATVELMQIVMPFFKLEARAAALLYAAQRAVHAANWKVVVVTDSQAHETDHTQFAPVQDKQLNPLQVLHALRIVAKSKLDITGVLA